MREEAKILLAIIRDANKQDIDLRQVMPLLVKHLRISNPEIMEIGEIIKADIRELNANYPGFADMVERTNRAGPGNPYGI